MTQPDLTKLGSFAEAMTILSELTKMESAINSVLKTSRVPKKEVRKLLRSQNVQQASNTPVYQFLIDILRTLGFGDFVLEKIEPFRLMFAVHTSPVSKLFKKLKGQKTCNITVDTLTRFFTEDLSLPCMVEENQCINETDGEICKFEITIQPLSVYEIAFEETDKKIIDALIKKEPIENLLEHLDLMEDELKFRLEILQRYHIIDGKHNITEIGITYQKFGKSLQLSKDEDFPPPWQKFSEITDKVSEARSFADAFHSALKSEEQVKIKEEDIINLVEEAKKCKSFAELLTKITRKEEKKDDNE